MRHSWPGGHTGRRWISRVVGDKESCSSPRHTWRWSWSMTLTIRPTCRRRRIRSRAFSKTALSSTSRSARFLEPQSKNSVHFLYLLRLLSLVIFGLVRKKMMNSMTSPPTPLVGKSRTKKTTRQRVREACQLCPFRFFAFFRLLLFSSFFLFFSILIPFHISSPPNSINSNSSPSLH